MPQPTSYLCLRHPHTCVPPPHTGVYPSPTNETKPSQNPYCSCPHEQTINFKLTEAEPRTARALTSRQWIAEHSVPSWPSHPPWDDFAAKETPKPPRHIAIRRAVKRGRFSTSERRGMPRSNIRWPTGHSKGAATGGAHRRR